MSYSVYIFDSRVRTLASQHADLDEFEHPQIDPTVMDRFLQRLAAYGYVPEGSGVVSKEFVRHVDGCPISVNVCAAEIAFSVPYWANATTAIAEALQDASELADDDSLVTFNPQTEEWA